MKINELRLGNWWDNGEGGQYIIDTSTMIDFLNEASEKNGEVDIDPIPLTKQWVKDFEFKECYVLCFKKDEWKINIMSDGTKYFLQWNTTKNLAKIKYVHELQNIYFTLTGKELIKK